MSRRTRRFRLNGVEVTATVTEEGVMRVEINTAGSEIKDVRVRQNTVPLMKVPRVRIDPEVFGETFVAGIGDRIGMETS